MASTASSSSTRSRRRIRAAFSASSEDMATWCPRRWRKEQEGHGKGHRGLRCWRTLTYGNYCSPRGALCSCRSAPSRGGYGELTAGLLHLRCSTPKDFPPIGKCSALKRGRSAARPPYHPPCPGSTPDARIPAAPIPAALIPAALNPAAPTLVVQSPVQSLVQSPVQSPSQMARLSLSQVELSHVPSSALD